MCQQPENKMSGINNEIVMKKCLTKVACCVIITLRAYVSQLIPKYKCAGPVQQDLVNHVRRETEQH